MSYGIIVGSLVSDTRTRNYFGFVRRLYKKSALVEWPSGPCAVPLSSIVPVNAPTDEEQRDYEESAMEAIEKGKRLRALNDRMAGAFGMRGSS